METYLDLFIIVAMSLIAISLLSVLFMYILKNEKIKKVLFYLTILFGLYIAYVGFRIHWMSYGYESMVAILMGLLAISALILERMNKSNSYQIAQILSSVSVVFGLLNAFII